MNKPNLLMCTDVYKLSHMTMYAPGTTKVYSYLCARAGIRPDSRIMATVKHLVSDGLIAPEAAKEALEKAAEGNLTGFNEVVFVGLQYYLMNYLSCPITRQDADEFYGMHSHILGPTPDDVRQKVEALVTLGYMPLEIKAVPEGTVVPVKNVLMTITNTHPDFYWCVGFVESLILKIWYPISVASTSLQYREVVEEAFAKTVDEDMFFLRDFMVHDFGYRGDHDEEGAAISGAAHLTSFTGSDTVPAYPLINNVYNAHLAATAVPPIMLSVPASEHSVMCSYGRDGEKEAFVGMLTRYPTGLVSIVSDTYSIWNVLTNIAVELKDLILGRDGKTVFRPDSGNPEDIICGNENAVPGTPEHKGCIVLLDELFGHTVNAKGYKVLNPKVGLIYGDGMYLARYKRTVARLEKMGYAASNLVIGVGGILRDHTRDTIGAAIKATYVEVNGEAREIEKDPITDPGKKSHKGLMMLTQKDGEFVTVDQCTPKQEKAGLLVPVFRDGKVLVKYSLEEVRERVASHYSNLT